MAGRRTLALVAACIGAAALTSPAFASEPLADTNVSNLTLKVNRASEALITYTKADGTVRRVLAWGAMNALHPSADVPQVRFKYDYAGGWGKYRKQVFKTFKNVCQPYDGPALPYLTVACKAPDGSYWAIQSWQRLVPLLGFAPWLPQHTAWELHLSHWTSPLAELQVHVNWTYDGAFHGVFGRLTYQGVPVHGFGTTNTGNPKDRYGRNLYIDTHNSAYGPGWMRESGIVAHKPTGTFCHSFVPQKPFPDYPSQELRPAAPGDAYRITVMGPGVTPVIQWEGPGLGGFDGARDNEVNGAFDALMAGDRICARER